MNDQQHGRFIDTELGILEGEGSQQITRQSIAPAVRKPFGDVPSMVAEEPGGPAYYDQPLLQTPVWIWSVPVYFYVGGTAGGALMLASAAQLSRDSELLRGLIERCRWIGLLGIGLGSAFLVIDLGRPARFLNMLRVFRPSSPLSVGSWLLTTAGPLAGLAAVASRFNGPIRKIGDLAAHYGGFMGVPIAGYTGVVLADTAVPVWQEARRMLPVFFIGSAMAGTGSLLELMNMNRREEKVATTFSRIGKAAELAGAFLAEKEACRVGRVAKAYREGRSGNLWKLAKALSAASLLVSLLPGRSRAKRILSGLLGSAGALTIRFAIFEAGKVSAADARAAFEKQRRGHGAYEVTGTAAVVGPDGRRAVTKETIPPPGTCEPTPADVQERPKILAGRPV